MKDEIKFDLQCLWVTFTTQEGNSYYITSDKFRDSYFLWKDKKGKPSLTKYKSENPLDLYKYCK